MISFFYVGYVTFKYPVFDDIIEGRKFIDKKIPSYWNNLIVCLYEY
jgi:hypothetical protein